MPCCRRWAGRPRSTWRSRSRRTGRSRGSGWSSSAPSSMPFWMRRIACASARRWRRSASGSRAPPTSGASRRLAACSSRSGCPQSSVPASHWAARAGAWPRARPSSSSYWIGVCVSRREARRSWSSRSWAGRSSSSRSCETGRTTWSSFVRSRTSTRWAFIPAIPLPWRRRRRLPTRSTSACVTPRSASSARWGSTREARIFNSRCIPIRARWSSSR